MSREMNTIKKSCSCSLMATCFEKKHMAKTVYVKILIAQNSSKALNSSSSQFWFMKNSSKIKIVLPSITDFECVKAHFVDVYKSASKFITDARGRETEKKLGSVLHDKI